MKKLLLAAMLAALTPAANASVTLVCGDHALQILTNSDRAFMGVDVEGEGYEFMPLLLREVQNGKLVTTFRAINADISADITITSIEKTRTDAELKPLPDAPRAIKGWKAQCRMIGQ